MSLPIGTSQSARTDSDSAKISSDSIGLRGIPHRNGAEYVGESKDLAGIHPKVRLKRQYTGGFLLDMGPAGIHREISA